MEEGNSEDANNTNTITNEDKSSQDVLNAEEAIEKEPKTVEECSNSSQNQETFMDIDEELTPVVKNSDLKDSRIETPTESRNGTPQVSPEGSPKSTPNNDDKEKQKEDKDDSDSKAIDDEPVLTPIGVRTDFEEMEQDDVTPEENGLRSPALDLFEEDGVEGDNDKDSILASKENSPGADTMDIDSITEELDEKPIVSEITKLNGIVRKERADEDIKPKTNSINSKEVDERTEIDSDGDENKKEVKPCKLEEDGEEDSGICFYNKECVNYECKSKANKFSKAPLFVLNFYKIPRKSNKVQYVCDDCYEKAVLQYEDLCSTMSSLQPLLEKCFPSRQDFVEILDSSDEDEKEDLASGDVFYNKDIGKLLQNELADSVCNILSRVEIENQLSWTKQILKNKLMKLEEQSMEITLSLNALQKSADQMHNSLYQCPKIKIRELQPLDLNTGRPYTTESEFTIPPAGELQCPPMEINGTYYAVKNKAIASWLPCRLIEFMDIVMSGQKSLKYYKIKFYKIKIPTIKCVSAKHMAYGDPPRVRLQIGTRVIALFDGSTLSRNKEKPPNIKSAFYPGIIAEPLQAYNRYRYLIFFDDGYAQYVCHKDVRVVCHVADNVWEDVHPASREFIQNYLTQYSKNRPMVQVKKGQSMITESNGKWLYAKVVDIDASLVQMQFDGQNRTEWIYRGSTRLGPLFRERQTKNPTQISNLPRRSEPYIRYMQDEEPANKSETNSCTGEKQPRAVAKKSVSKPNESQTPVKHLNNSTIFLEDDNKPKGKVVYYTAKKNISPKNYVPHDCNPNCLFNITHNLSSYSPLSKPLLSGWERQIFKTKLKKVVVYRGPCGRRLRNMEELHRYLRQTKNVLNVDNFDFDPLIHCLAEYHIDSSIVQKSDLSEGAEHMIIPCINYYDNTMPPECKYSTKRIPTDGVNMNLDPAFLVGCDCEDDCADKSKCSCWQLTLAGARFGNPNTPTENVGYNYKRLPEHVPTGIYECNANCRCSKQCINRVVQEPLQMKLQVFKTSNRGWGLRCINDVPKGSFICIYAGHLLTEQNANEGGANSGDEYFAELDYIESVERLKEGYESDVQEEPESEEEFEEPTAENDSDEEFRSSASINKNARVNTRLRARKETKDYSEEDRATSSKKNIDEDDEDERQVINFEPSASLDNDTTTTKYKSIRKYFGKNEYCYIMDAKKTGNIGRYFNHSCAPNLFVQNVFVDTHDLRFPWVAFFALTNIRAGTELTWNYNYEVGIVPGKVLYCECGAPNCRGRLL